VRLVDVIFRNGHLSEQALVAAVMTGERPAHLERCDLCAERAVDLGRWLDQVRATGIETADAAFPPERLLAQQQQILRRLEQLDQPARVIAFPNQYALSRDMGGRRVAAGWVAVAAAAGILLGVVGGQVTEGYRARAARVAAPLSQAARDAAPGLAPASATMLDETDLDRAGSSGLHTLDQMTPTVIMASVRK
jgi:hypothetical protein